MLRYLTVLSALLLLTSCGEPQQQAVVHELSGVAMGTSFSVKIVASTIAPDTEVLQRQIEDTLAVIEQQMSTYIADSELSLFNARHRLDWFSVSAALCELVAEALAISAATNGAFDITVGPLVNLWGFGPGGIVEQPPDADRIGLLMDRIGYTGLHADCSIPALRKDHPGLYVDLSAFAKGYGVDRLAALLDEKQISNYLVEIGGELRLRGRNAEGKRWAVAIETPARMARGVHAVARLTDVAVATSGDYRNYFEHDGNVYSHTIDPRTGYPIRHNAASVTVVATTAAHADAMATALLVLGPEDGLALAERDGIAALFLARDNGAFAELASSRFAAEVSYQ